MDEQLPGHIETGNRKVAMEWIESECQRAAHNDTLQGAEHPNSNHLIQRYCALELDRDNRVVASKHNYNRLQRPFDPRQYGGREQINWLAESDDSNL